MDTLVQVIHPEDNHRQVFAAIYDKTSE